MKCSSRRNCSAGGQGRVGGAADASMKCSSRRNCNLTPEMRGTSLHMPQ